MRKGAPLSIPLKTSHYCESILFDVFGMASAARLPQLALKLHL
jgi:hypothetical protein